MIAETLLALDRGTPLGDKPPDPHYSPRDGARHARPLSSFWIRQCFRALLKDLTDSIARISAGRC